jgi:hypothetical protein
MSCVHNNTTVCKCKADFDRTNLYILLQYGQVVYLILMKGSDNEIQRSEKQQGN